MNRAEYARMFEAEEKQWWYAGMRAISWSLLEKASLPPGARILDGGCGTGENLVHLGKMGEAIGIDLSEEALSLCATRGVRLVRGSVLGLPFGEGTFDLVTSFDVLYHLWVTDDRAAALELARVLKPGGVLLVRVPALRMLWGAHDQEVQSRHRYTLSELEALLVGAGLEVVVATYANFFLLPLLVLKRLTSRRGSDVQFLPPPVERSFRAVLALEAWLLRHTSLPLGASVFCLARKPRNPA